MAGNHMEALAAQIYNEQNIVSSHSFQRADPKVTYRLLSRLLGVHVNIAKQYDQSKDKG